jgi:hypothetical protein
MQELINRLTSKVGLNEQQAQQAGSGFKIPGFKH